MSSVARDRNFRSSSVAWKTRRTRKFRGIRSSYQFPRARTCGHDVEHTGRSLSADAVARPAGQSSEVGVGGRSVLENANEPVIPSPGVWHRQHVAARPVVRPGELHRVRRHGVDLAAQRHGFVTTSRDLAPLVARSASRRVYPTHAQVRKNTNDRSSRMRSSSSTPRGITYISSERKSAGSDPLSRS